MILTCYQLNQNTNEFNLLFQDWKIPKKGNIYSINESNKYIIESIFQLKWSFDFILFTNISISIALVTLVLIILTNLRYLNPKVYPLVRNE